MIARLALIAAALAAAQAPAPQAPAPQVPAANAGPSTPPPSVSELTQQLIAATDDAGRTKAAELLKRTAPVSAQDVGALFDLFSRFPNPDLRAIVMSSLARIPPDSPQLEPIFVTYLKESEPSAQLFGINGAFRLRSRAALPLIHKIAERRLASANPSAITVLKDRLEWNTQYEALSALAQWEGEKILPLLRQKSDESPDDAYLLGLFFWRQTLPDLPKWIQSKDPRSQQKALAAASAKIEPADARATREPMLAMLRDAALDSELRHRLALKVGLSSTDDEIDALIREHDAARDDATRAVWATAVFVSRSPRAVPLLARYARESPTESFRNGARAELVELVGEDKTRELLGESKDVKK
jgi:hypothetical protein